MGYIGNTRYNELLFGKYKKGGLLYLVFFTNVKIKLYIGEDKIKEKEGV